MKRRSFLAGLSGVGAGVLLASCSNPPTPSSPSDPPAGTTRTTGGTGAGGPGSAVPDDILAVMKKPRYAKATWSLLVADVRTGETFYALAPDTMVFTGSTRKLFSVGLALKTLGADHRITTPVHRTGDVDGQGTLAGNLVLVGSGDLTFGGRRVDDDTVQSTDFDHNDANALGTAILTPQDPLYALNRLAADVKASGITAVSGDVVVDDRLFTPYRVPNGKLLITPILVNENMVDLTVTPTAAGQPATVEYRPKTAALNVTGSVTSSASGDAGRPRALGQRHLLLHRTGGLLGLGERHHPRRLQGAAHG